MSLLDRVAIPNNVLDRIEELERRLADLESYAAMATVDGETEGGTTYYQITQEVDIGEGAGIDITGSPPEQTVGLGLDLPLVIHNDGSPASEYATLAAALSAATSGDVILLPPGTYSGDITVPAGASVVGVNREDCVIDGQVTLSNGSVLANLSIIRSENSASDVYGVLAPASGGTGWIYGCTISVENAGAGGAYGILAFARGFIGSEDEPGLVGCHVYGGTADVI